MMLFVIAASAVVVVFCCAAGASPSPLPSQQCGWPAVYNGGHFGPPTVRLAQYLLGNALHLQEINADGIFSANTTTEIKEFQTSVQLTADGFLGPETWAALVATAPLGPASSATAAISGLQDALTVNGFRINVTGVFNAATVATLAAFQSERRDPSCVNGTMVTPSTWHLLATGCNASGVFWFDAGWPQGSMSVETLTCLHDQGKFEFATFECWVEEGVKGSFWQECVDNIANAWTAGFEAVGVYMFPQRYYDAAPQAQWLLGNLTQNNVRFQAVMLDIEGGKWTQYTHEENQAFVAELRRVFDTAAVNVTVYCGDEWPDFFGSNFTAFSDLPLVYAHYDNVPSFYDFFPRYGGWDKPAGKQFWDGSQGEVICNSGALDWDWSSKRFW
jgi:peptidoglycan hydrolase-like protein with peptidoglycan-binding domain